MGAARIGTIDSYRVGVYLDAAFAMPHLRLGLMFRREGDMPAARRELPELLRCCLPRRILPACCCSAAASMQR